MKPTSIDFASPFDVQIAQARAQGVQLSPAYYALQAEKRAQAFTVSGLTKLDQVQTVADALSKSQAEGQTLREFQQWAKTQDWQLPKHRLETIYRNAAQTAYQAGHWRDFEENSKDRPYLMYDAINDSRVRPAHLAMDGIIKPVGDPYWLTHAAPNGHRCRCTLRSLSRAEAMAKGGVTQNAPVEGKADEGWGNKPTEWDKALDDLKAAKIVKAHPALGQAAQQAIDTGIPTLNLPTYHDAKTLKEANKIATEIVADSGGTPWPVNPVDNKTTIRFKHIGCKYSEDVRRKRLGTGSLNGLDVPTANHINRFLLDAHAQCDKIGIPRLRGVTTQCSSSASASMGDGILAVNKSSKVEFISDAVAENAAKNVSQWKPADGNNGKVPFSRRDYFATQKEKLDSTLWHEFGHLVHQTFKVDHLTYIKPPLERRIRELMVAEKNLIYPSGYAKTSPDEFFADCFSLYKMGRQDLVPNFMNEAIAKLERGEMP